MSKATPGPWSSDVGNNKATIHETNTGNLVAWVLDNTAYDIQTAPNARLIAAAPELLDALKVAVTRLKEWKLKTGDIEELIAKVEGK